MGIFIGILVGIFLVIFVVCPLLAWSEYRIGYRDYIKIFAL